MALTDQPAIILRASLGAPGDVIEAFAHGCEEMGVPLRVISGDGPAEALARTSAQDSVLGTGAGIDAHSDVVVAVARGRLAIPVLHLVAASAAMSRLAGGDAGRLVLGLPLRAVTSGQLSQESGSGSDGMLSRQRE